MLGRVIRVPGQTPLMGMLAGVVAIAMTVAALFTQEMDWLWWAILPWLTLMGSLFTRRPGFDIELTPAGLLFPDKGTTLEYGAIYALTLGKAAVSPQAARLGLPLQIIHQHGVVQINFNDGCDTAELYRFLAEEISRRAISSKQPVSSLMDYWESQVDTFGADQVHVFNARKDVGRMGINARWWFTLTAVLVTTGVLWIAHEHRGSPFAGMGVVAIVFGFFSFLVGCQQRSTPYSRLNWRSSSLVISPGGLALVQEPHSGKMRWEELKAIRTANSQTGGLGSAGRSLALDVQGATILLLDVYDAPMAVIHERLLTNWKPPADKLS